MKLKLTIEIDNIQDYYYPWEQVASPESIELIMTEVKEFILHQYPIENAKVTVESELIDEN